MSRRDFAPGGSFRSEAKSEAKDLTEYMNENKYNIAAIYFLIFRYRSNIGRLVVLLLLGLGTGCGQLYRVSPLVKTAGDLVTGRLGDVMIEARGLAGDRSLEQFEGNLPMAGVLAVEVRVSNRGPASLALPEIEYLLKDSAGTECQPLTPARALTRVMKFYGNRIYQVEAHRETVRSYERIALRRAGELAAGEEAGGILFFAIPRQPPPEGVFSLRISRSGQSISLAIAGGAGS